MNGFWVILVEDEEQRGIMSNFEEMAAALMKDMVVSVLVDIIREEMHGMNSSSLKESLLDEADKFRAAIVSRMTDVSLTPLDTFKVERLPSAFQEAWKTWKTGGDATGHAQFDKQRREEVSYRAFLDTIAFKSPVEKDKEQ